MAARVEAKVLGTEFYPVRVVRPSGRALALIDGRGQEALDRAELVALMWNVLALASERLEMDRWEFLDALQKRRELVTRAVCDVLRGVG